MKSKARVELAIALGVSLALLISCGRETGEQNAENPSPTPARGEGIPLPDSAFLVEWQHIEAPPTISAGKTVAIAVTFKNSSPNEWPDPKHAGSSGAYAVRLSSRWWKIGEAEPFRDYEGRADLKAPLPSGQSTTLLLRVTAPSQPGEYTLQFDLVDELVSWFEEKGAAKELVKIRVS